MVLLRLNWLKANLTDLAIRLLVIPEERWMTLVFRSRSSTEHFIISQWLSSAVFDFKRYCLRRQRISITAKLLATRSKPLNSNQRTRPECRESFGRKVLNTVWAESLKIVAWAMDRRTIGSIDLLKKSQSKRSLSKHSYWLIRWLDMLGSIGKRHWSNASLWGGELYAGHGWSWRRVVWYLWCEDSPYSTDIGTNQLGVYGRWPYRFGLILIQTD